MAESQSSIVDLKKFFTPAGEQMTIQDFKKEWDQLSDEEKAWFKAQPLPKG